MFEYTHQLFVDLLIGGLGLFDALIHTYYYKRVNSLRNPHKLPDDHSEKRYEME
jgi:hypothetical protein